MKQHLLAVVAAAMLLALLVSPVSAENVLIFRNGVSSPDLTAAKGASVTWMDRSQLNAHVEFTSPTPKGVLLQATKAGLKATFTEPGVHEYIVHLSPETSTPHQLRGKVTVR